MAYRWKADERAFAMPIRIGTRGHVADDPPDHRLAD